MKFLHTADWQIGMKATNLGSSAESVRSARLDSASRMLEKALEANVDFALIAGDVFEDNGVSPRLVFQTVELLRRFGRPAYVIAGNHDPYVPGSVWTQDAWKAAPNVVIVRENVKIELDECILYACPALSRHSKMCPTSWIEHAGLGKELGIGIAHGTVEGLPVEKPDFPIPRNEASRAGLTYLALGHWHSQHKFPQTEPNSMMAYSGTHEATGFGERDSGGAFIVDLAAANSEPILTRIETGVLEWLTIDAAVDDPSDIESICARVDALPRPTQTLARVVLRGILSPETEDILHQLQMVLEERLLYGRIESSDLVPAPNDETWVAGLPVGYLRDVALGLLEEATDSPVAKRALIELYSATQEAVK